MQLILCVDQSIVTAANRHFKALNEKNQVETENWQGRNNNIL